MKVFRWLKFMLAVVGFLALLKYGVITLISFTSDSDDDVASTVYLSPNGKYSAARVTRTGGGAIAPFCSDSVVVFNSLQTVGEVVAYPEYQVYSAECDTFFDHETSPKVRWDSDNDLQVDFAIGSTRSYSRKIDLRATDASGSVQIRFSAYR